jgi:hypothetical protein
MSLSQEEKMMIQEALQVYLQIVARQAPQGQVQQIASIAEGIMQKLDTLGSATEPGSNKPKGISDEWYENVCLQCDKLTPSGCSDKVTEKYPGKCDPILHYENAKARGAL